MRKEIYRDGKLIDTEWTGTLDQHKQERIDEIDARTAELLSSGVIVAPQKRLSTSLPAQVNLQGLAHLRLLGRPFVPQDVSTVDGGTYTIRDEPDFHRVADIVTGRRKQLLESGQRLRAMVFSATTHEAVDAIRDTRR